MDFVHSLTIVKIQSMSIFKPQNQRVIDRYRAGRIRFDRSYYPNGKEHDPEMLTDQEIAEMSYGFFRDKKAMLTGDYFLDMNKVVGAYCTLQDVSYIKPPTQSDYETHSHKIIDNIRTFFFKDYFLLTDELINGEISHRITNNLLSAGAIHKGNASHRGLNRVFNKNKSFQKYKAGYFPTDLFDPIKLYVNEFFFEDSYWINDFYLKTGIEIKMNTRVNQP